MSSDSPEIPFVDLAAQNAAVLEDAMARIRRVIERGSYILGPEVAELERELARYVGVEHVIGVGNGTDALVLALRALGVGEGDEVVVPSHTFVASVAAVCLVGATPVFADVDARTMVVSAETMAAGIGPRTAALLPVHLNGYPCDMPALMGLAEARGIHVVEDAAQALGASRSGRMAGSWGVGCFSLHPLKVLGSCGDAGVISTSDPELAYILRQERNLGLRSRDEAERIAGNSRLDTLHAAILLAKLPHLETWIGRRNEHARAYRAGLAGLVTLPPEEEQVRAIESPFVIRLEEGRDRLQKHLADVGVDAKVHYPIPVHRQQAYRRFHDEVRAPLPETERVVGQILSLPCSPELEVEARDRVIALIQEALA